uniref:A superfamily conotoxin Vr1.1 n=1 Tax=Conus varius TaxID=89448 RepID=S4UJT1_CONVA|nr:A superfamily conotoxin Vr1.1 precursor [Conus varius]
MGMRMMFILFLLVVLATTVVSFPSDRASDGVNTAAELIARATWDYCCPPYICDTHFPSHCK